MLEMHLKQLTDELNLNSKPQLDKDRFFVLTFNSELTLKLKEHDPGLALFAQIGPCPQMKREELFSYLMRANFLGQGTGGATLALDGTESFLTLSSILPYDMNYKMFRDAVEDFANYVDYWKTELIQHKEKSSD